MKKKENYSTSNRPLFARLIFMTGYITGNLLTTISLNLIEFESGKRQC